MSALFLPLQTGAVVAASRAESGYCEKLRKSAGNSFDLPEYCRSEYEYVALKIVGGLTVFGAVAMMVANYDDGPSQSSPVAADSAADRRVLGPANGEVGPVDIDRLNAVLSSPGYNKRFREFSNFDDYNEVGLAYSLARGFGGAGAKVAVLDTGVAGTAAAPGSSYSISNPTWHGTAVANLIGAVAPDSEIVARRITDGTNRFVSYSEIAGLIGDAVGRGAAVVNNSWGIATKIGGHKNVDAGDIRNKNDLIALVGREFLNSVADAARTNDVVFVWAAGNEGGAQSNAISAIPLFYSEFQTDDGGYKNFINVVAWDGGKGGIAEFSNHCGRTMHYCLTAPGANLVLEVFKNNDVETPADRVDSGTSFAAPIVSGAVAVLKSAHPFLTGGEISRLLFATARDLGAAGVDEVYGHGMLDLEAASRPFGELSVGGAGLSVAHVSDGSVVGAAIARANPSMMFVDSFGRGFETKIASHMAFDRRPKSLAVLQKFGNGAPSSGHGARVRPNPYFAESGDRLVAARDFDLGGGVSFAFDFAYNEYDFGFARDENKKADSIAVVAALKFDSARFDFGVMGETNSLLGSGVSGEWLAIGKNSATAMFGFQDDIKIAGGVSATFRADFGVSLAEAADGSLIADISPVYSSAFSAGLNWGGFSLAVSRPLKVEYGAAELALPVSQNADGTLNYARRRLSLKNNPAMEYGLDYDYKNMSFGLRYGDGELMLLFRAKKLI
jgi:hypothetical protein